MSFMPRHILEERIGDFGRPVHADHLTVLRRPAIASVLAGGPVEALSGMAEVSLRPVGPGQWLAVSQSLPGLLLAESLAAALAGQGAHVVDQSDGTVLMRIAGPNVRRILAKCIAVDLHPQSFAVGQAAAMMCCHVAASVARVGADAFEIAVPRSYADDVFEEIVEMGREFSLTSAFDDA